MHMSKRIQCVLTIGGSDSSGGAGIQEDLKVFSALELHGCSVITCVTAQNTERISSVYPVPTEEVGKQLDAVLSDIELKAVKTGVLYSSDIVITVARKLKKLECPVVVDPVLVATVGKKLHIGDYVDAFKEELIPISYLITPNREEASILTGLITNTIANSKIAAKALTKMGAKNVVIKGFEAGNEVIDLYYDGKVFTELSGSKYKKVVHGSGCAFASAIAAYVAKDVELKNAVKRSKDFVSMGYLYSYDVGKGLSVLNLLPKVDRYEVLKELENGVDRLKEIIKQPMIPEVGLNFGYALPFASSYEDVCAMKGRLRIEGKAFRSGAIEFGASKHIATIILTAMRFDPEMRSSVNLKYNEKSVVQARKAGLKVETFNRKDEPPGRSSMEWGVESILEKTEKVPDVIFDLGSVGKEPMIRVLGRNPLDVLRKLESIVKVMK
jgi:hydroxymethylpyrimidine kinase/phosphomethylpyrimidine kinase